MGGWAKIGENLNQYTNKMEEIFVSAEENPDEELHEALTRAADGSICISLWDNFIFYKLGGYWYPIGG